MIPLTSYPETKAEARVNTLEDQFKHSIKTLRKAGTIHVGISETPGPVDRAAFEITNHTPENLITRFNGNPGCIRKGKKINIGYCTKIFYTGPFNKFKYRVIQLPVNIGKYEKATM